MSKVSFSEQIDLRIHILEKWAAEKERSLKRAPEGKLRAFRHGKTFKYFWRRNPKDKRGEYLAKSQLRIIQRLAQKEYDEKLLMRARKELSLLIPLRSLYTNCCETESAYHALPEGKRILVDRIEGDAQARLEKWINEPCQTSPSYETTYEYLTENKELVRSKSELIIANKLAAAGIPYKYEKPLLLIGQGTVYPDFTIYDAENDREIYLEHLGKMSDSEYVERNLPKINAYQTNGYLLGQRLFLTFESENIPLDMRMVDLIIKELKEVLK